MPFELLQLPGPPSVDVHSPCDKISLSSSGVQQWCLNTLGCVVVAGELSPGQDQAVVFGVGVLGFVCTVPEMLRPTSHGMRAGGAQPQEPSLL